MGRINRLIPTTTLTANSVIAMDAESGGATNKVTIQTLAAGLRSFGDYATQAQLAAKQDVLTFDDAPEEDSENPVTSGGIYNAIGSAMSNVYTKTETDNAIAQSTAKATGTLTPPSGYSANPTTLYKSGSMVWLSTTLTIPSWTTKNLAISGIIPTGFRPADSVNFVGADNTNDTATNCIIDVEGKLTIYRSTTTASTSLRIGACWMV